MVLLGLAAGLALIAPGAASALPAGSEYPSTWTIVNSTTATGVMPSGITVTATLGAPSSGTIGWLGESSGSMAVTGSIPAYMPSTPTGALRPNITGCTAAPCGGITYTFSKPVITPSLAVSDVGAQHISGAGTAETFVDHPISIAGGGTFTLDSAGSQTPGLSIQSAGTVLGITNPAAHLGRPAKNDSCSGSASEGFGCGAYDLHPAAEATTKIAFAFAYAGTGAEPDVMPFLVAAIPAVPAIAVTKSANISEFKTAGTNVTYSYEVTNTGNVTLNPVVVKDPMPGLSSVSCPKSSLVVGEKETCTATYTTTEADLTAGELKNIATVEGTPPGTEGEPSPPPVKSTTEHKIPAKPEADLEIVKTVEPKNVVAGEKLTYTLFVHNNGPSPAVDVKVTDDLPNGLTFVSASNGCSNGGGTITCTIDKLAAGASKEFTVTAKISSSAKGSIKNTAKVTSETPDPNPPNNTTELETPPKGVSDLSLTKTPSTRTAEPGGQVIYTLVARNLGPSDSASTKVSDPGAAGLIIESARSSQGSCTVTGGALDCDLGMLVDGGSAQVLVIAKVAPDAVGPVTNVAHITGPNEDPEPKNNVPPATFEVPTPPAPPPTRPTADLEIVKTARDRSATVGKPITYLLKVSNKGPDPAPEVTITDTANLPVRIVSATPSVGSCAKGVPLECSLGTMRAGATVAIKVVAIPQRAGNLRNAASTTSPATDPDPKNNISSVTRKVEKPALKITKTASARRIKAGGAVTYEIRVSNPSPVAIREVTVCDTLPAGMVLVSAPHGAKLNNGAYCWRLAKLASRVTETYSVKVRALKGTGGKKVNIATVTSPNANAGKARRAVRVTPAPPVNGGVTG